MGRVDIEQMCSSPGRRAGELTRRDIARALLGVPARDALSSLPRLRRQLLAAGRPQSAAFWDDTERTLSAIVDDEELWLAWADAVVDGGHGPPLDGRLDDEVLAAWMSLQHADWIGAVVTLVTVGPGAVADAETLAHHAATFDFETDLEGDPPHDPESPDATAPWEWDAWWDDLDGGYDAEPGLRIGFEIVAALWQALGALDDDQRLTELGWWGLPEALHRAWGGTADATE